jgi:hypothetical protein
VFDLSEALLRRGATVCHAAVAIELTTQPRTMHRGVTCEEGNVVFS